ncbi:MAG: aminotransferase class V-fold PLP-dependent enzyme [bacterium]
MIYLDNAATSCPKPPEVIEAVAQALGDVCANPSRGAYEVSLQASRSLLRTRRAVADLFNIQNESQVVFTLNATHALNIALKGLLTANGMIRAAGRARESQRAGNGARRSGRAAKAHVVTSSVEHNAVARPLSALTRSGVEVTRVPCSSDGATDPDDILAAVRPHTALVVLTHASNVLGTILPVAQVGPRLRERGVPLLVDAAQTAGSFPIDVEAMGISLLAVSGHKGLLGPQGVGALYISPHLQLGTLVEGGTGSRSESLEQPTVCPDRFEAGTPNSPGIAGLGAGIEVVNREGVSARGARERTLARRLRDRLSTLDGLRLHGPSDPVVPTAPIISLAIEGLASSEVAHVLDKEFDIAVRAGLHCAPEAHRVAGTLDTGLVRLSVGHATTEAEVDAAAEALIEIANKPATYWLAEWEGHHAR